MNIRLLWSCVKSDSEKSFSDIFVHTYPFLFQYGIKIYNHPSLVKDSIQDVFVRIWEKRKTLGNVQSPKAYLASSVRRKILENKKALKLELSDELCTEDVLQSFSFSDSEFIETKEISVQLRNMLVKEINLLPRKQRELIFLRFHSGLRYKEIAEVMDIKEQTVRNLMQRTLTNIRSKVDLELLTEIDNVGNLLVFFFLCAKKY
uniref:RNA polymerase sigma factor n=1 Tax=uncultured Draconibacterium sp. TaxID=1573823 RepID=UPI0032173FE0